MCSCFLGKDPDSQGWRVIDPVPQHEILIEIPEDVLRMYVRRYQQQEER